MKALISNEFHQKNDSNDAFCSGIWLWRARARALNFSANTGGEASRGIENAYARNKLYCSVAAADARRVAHGIG